MYIITSLYFHSISWKSFHCMLLPASHWDWVSVLSVLSWQCSLEPADAVISPTAVGSNAVTKNIYIHYKENCITHFSRFLCAWWGPYTMHTKSHILLWTVPIVQARITMEVYLFKLWLSILIYRVQLLNVIKQIVWTLSPYTIFLWNLATHRNVAACFCQLTPDQ